MTRLNTMLKQCRKKGGDCPCRSGYCEAEVVLTGEILRLEAQLAAAKRTKAWLDHDPCTIKPGWQMPEKPAGDYIPAVSHEAGWHPHWYSDTEVTDYIEMTGEESWPFVDGIAYAEDWEQAGFKVLNSQSVFLATVPNYTCSRCERSLVTAGLDVH